MHPIARVLIFAVGALATGQVLGDAEADRFFLHQRLAPGSTKYPTQQVLDAYADSLELPLYSSVAGREIPRGASAKSLAPLAWTALGPTNIGGRTRAIRFEPGSSTRVYAGGVAGGVWRSDDAGGSWTPLGDAMANLAVTAILVNPSNPQILIAGTGESIDTVDAVRGAGVFRSTNGGASWTQATGTASATAINAMAMKPGDPSVVYAATNAGLLRSLDGGASFADVSGPITFGCQSVVYGSPDTVVASCTYSTIGALLVRTANASAATPTFTTPLGQPGSGATTTLPNMGHTELAIAPSNHQVLYALIACAPASATDCGNGAYSDGLLAVYQSINGGANWTARKTNTFVTSPTANSDLLLTNAFLTKRALCGDGGANSFTNVGSHASTIAVDPLDPTKVFAGGVDLWRSDDSGASWGLASYWWYTAGDTRFVHGEQHVIAFDPAYNGTSNQIMFLGGDGGIYQTANARAATGTATSNDTNNSICGRTNQTTMSWGNRNNGYTTAQFNHGTVYPEGSMGLMKIFGGTTDNSLILTRVGTPTWTINYGLMTGDELAPWTYVPLDAGFTAYARLAQYLYMSTRRIAIRRNGNDGIPANSGWTSKISGIATPTCGLLINPFAMDPNTESRLFTSHNVLWRTSDNGDSWTQASAALSGTSCTPADTAQAERFSNYAIAPGNSNLLVAGTDQGRICRLTNATTSNNTTPLADCTSPAGNAFVSAIAFDPNDVTHTTVYATFSTFGVGHVWRSTNAGQTWSNIDGSGGGALPNSPAHTVVVSPFTSNTIYVGTEIGVFVTRDGGTSWARENTGFANVITDHLLFYPTGPTGQKIFAFTHGRGAWSASVIPTADVSISVTDGQASAKAGASVTYTIVASNPTANAVDNVAVADTFPASLTSCTWTCSAPGGSCTGSGSGSIAETTVRIAAAGTATFTATCTLASTAAGSLANTATVNYGADANAANDSATDTDTIVPLADLSISKNDGRTTANPGGQVNYNIDVLNANTAAAAAGVNVVDNFPAALTNCSWVCFNSAGGSCGNASGNGPINETVIVGPNTGPGSGFLGYGITCTLAANATGTLTNTATVSFSNDPNAANDSSSDVDAITLPADVSLTNTDGATSVNAGSGVTYTIVATNNSAGAIGFVTVTDNFPASLTACTWTCTASSGSDCGGAGGTGNINRVVSLAASGGTATFAAGCTLSSTATGTLSNTANAAYPNDPTPGNNGATDVDSIVPDADVSITKSDGVTGVMPGASVVYTIVATNPAAVAITGVRVTDTFVAALTGCTWTCAASSGGSCAVGSGSGDIDRLATLAAGGTVTYVATCTLSMSATGTLTNAAHVSYANDTHLIDNDAIDIDTVLGDMIFKNGFE